VVVYELDENNKRQYQQEGKTLKTCYYSSLLPKTTSEKEKTIRVYE
jgi:hypothetical protein